MRSRAEDGILRRVYPGICPR